MARIVALCVMAQTSWASPAGDALPEASQRIWSAAVEAREQGDTRGEERALRALIRMNPDFAPPWTELADLLVDQGRVEEAVELLSARSMDVDAVARRAQWLLDLARPDEARVLAARLQRLAPESELGLRLRAASWVGDKPLLAHRWLDDWWTHPSRDTLTDQDAELVAAVMDALHQQSLEHASPEADEALGLWYARLAGTPEGELPRLAGCLDRHRVEVLAVQWAQAAGTPLAPAARRLLRAIEAQLRDGDPAAAQAQAERLAGDYPESAEVRALVARARIANGAVGQAEQALREAVRLAPAEPRHARALGRFLVDHFGGHYAADAETWFLRALQARPGSGELWLDIADARWMQGKLDQAAEAYRRAEELGMDGVPRVTARQRVYDRHIQPGTDDGPAVVVGRPAAFWVARVFASEGRATEAREALDRARAAGDSGPQLDELAGNIAEMEGRLEDAEAHYRAAMLPDGPRVGAGLALADLMVHTGRAEQALDVWRDVALLPGGGAASLRLARWHLENGDAATAAEWSTVSLDGGLTDSEQEEAESILAIARSRVRQRKAVLASVALGVVLAPWALWLYRRRGASVQGLMQMRPGASNDLAPVLASLRHEVIKHNATLLDPMADALESGDTETLLWASERLYGPDGVHERFDQALERLTDVGTRHGVSLNLAVVDPVFAPAVAAMGRLRAVQGAVESGDPRCAPTLRAVAGVLTRDTYASVGVLLSKGYEAGVNDEQVARAWDFVQAEPARRGSSDVRLRLDLPPGLAVKGRAGDLHDILANLLRNALEAGASRIEVSAEVEEDWVTGLEQICVRVADDVPSGLTTERLRSRFVARGLGLVVDLVHRFRGSVCVEPRADYAKCVAVRLPRAEPIHEEPSS